MNIKIEKFEVPPLNANCYAIGSDENPCVTLIDAGGDFERVNEHFKEQGKKITDVLLTHGHFDHIGAAADFQKAGAKIHLTQADENLIKNGGDMGRYFGCKTKPFIVDNRLIEGLFSLNGVSFNVIFTPGHTAGGVCFLIGDYIFTGDTLMKNSIGRYDFISGSRADLKASLNKLFTLCGGNKGNAGDEDGEKRDYIVMPGHGERTSLLCEKENFSDIILKP